MRKQDLMEYERQQIKQLVNDLGVGCCDSGTQAKMVREALALILQKLYWEELYGG